MLSEALVDTGFFEDGLEDLPPQKPVEDVAVLREALHIENPVLLLEHMLDVLKTLCGQAEASFTDRLTSAISEMKAPVQSPEFLQEKERL